jgi:Asp-tRNA(Asn)/Glu-tRNA(Gln) amidotransferase A subunit family amidase
MARTAEDLRLLFRILAGHDPSDPFSAPVPIRTADLSGISVGVLEQYADVPVHPSVRDAVRSAARVLSDLGIPTDAFDISGLERAPDLWWFFFAELTAPFTREVLAAHDADAHWTGREFLGMVMNGHEITGREVVEALGIRDRLRGVLLQRMRKTPVLLMPVCGVPAFRARERSWTIGNRTIGLRDAMAPSTPFNLFGMPAVTIPFGMSEDGLPVGVQLVGCPWEEEVLLDLAVRMEEARGAFPFPPAE